MPGERDILTRRNGAFGPEIAWIAGLAELGVNDGNGRVQQFGVEHALHGCLQPTRHRNVVCIDPPLVLSEFALQIENVSRPCRGEDDAPEAGISRVIVAIGGAQPDEWILASNDDDIGIRSAHGFSFVRPVEVGI